MSGNKTKAQFDTDHEASSKISMPLTPMGAEPDPEFYFEDSLVVIQVESALFRVHRFQLLKSEIFSDMFKMPKDPTNELEEGASPEHPIVLKGVMTSEFRALLRVLYAFQFSNKKLNCEPEVIVPAFRLAHKWNFEDLRTHLLPLVKDALGCVDKIVIARELGLQEWLVPAHVELCQRAESLTRKEGIKLGIDSTIMIARLREQYRPAQSAPSSGRSWDYCGQSCLKAYHWGSYGGTTCRGCNGHMTGTYYRVPATPPSTVPPSSNEALENQVKVWVESECIAE